MQGGPGSVPQDTLSGSVQRPFLPTSVARRSVLKLTHTGRQWVQGEPSLQEAELHLDLATPLALL